MAKTTTESSLQARINSAGARNESRYSPPKTRDSGNLPAGIKGGIAKLTRVDFNLIENGPNAGEQRFYCHGICVEPVEFTDAAGKHHKTEGKLVQPRMITLADVKSQYGESTFAENVAKAEERLKLLGFPTADFDDLEKDTLDYFGSGTEMYFSFDTWKPKDGDNVVLMINGPVKDYTPAVTDDVTEVSNNSEEEQPTHYQPEDIKSAAKKEEKPAVNVLALAKKADAGDEPSQSQLADVAFAAGINPEAAEYDNWTAVAKAILKKDAEDHAPVSSANTRASNVAPSNSPKFGDVWNYNNEPCEVTLVNARRNTVSLKALTTDAEYSDIKWSDLAEIV